MTALLMGILDILMEVVKLPLAVLLLLVGVWLYTCFTAVYLAGQRDQTLQELRRAQEALMRCAFEPDGAPASTHTRQQPQDRRPTS